MYFNAAEEEYKEELVPQGWHRATVEAIELKVTKNGGSYWNVRFGIDGTGKNFFHMFHWTHLSNADFQARSRSQFADFAVACGVDKAESEDDLQFGISGKSLYIKVGHRVNKDTGDTQAEIKDVADLNKKHRKKGQLKFDVVSTDVNEPAF